jgi:uncharacterized damage-inducible protein DinB
MAKPIAESLKFTEFIMNLVTGDLKNEDAVRRIRETEGASISWIVGHLCHYRYLMLNLLGSQAESPFADSFGNAGASDGSDYPDIAELRRLWNETATEVWTVVASATDEQLTSPLPGSASPHKEKTVLDTLVFFMWHESYHTGQLGTIRAQLGYKPTAQLAVEASQ